MCPSVKMESEHATRRTRRLFPFAQRYGRRGTNPGTERFRAGGSASRRAGSLCMTRGERDCLLPPRLAAREQAHALHQRAPMNARRSGDDVRAEKLSEETNVFELVRSLREQPAAPEERRPSLRDN